MCCLKHAFMHFFPANRNISLQFNCFKIATVNVALSSFARIVFVISNIGIKSTASHCIAIDKFCLADCALKVTLKNNCLRLSFFASLYTVNVETTTCSTVLALQIVESLGSCLIIVLSGKGLTIATRLDCIQDGGVLFTSCSSIIFKTNAGQ